MSRRSLIEKIDGLPALTFAGDVLRSVSPGWSPLSGDGARVNGGRWNPPNSFPVVYTALDAGTAAMEIRRTARRFGVPETSLLPRYLVTIRVSLTQVLDLTDLRVLGAAGLTPAVLTDDDLRICQAVGDAAHYIGFEGILAASAAAPSTTLSIFPNRLKPSSSLEVIRTELLDVGDVT